MGGSAGATVSRSEGDSELADGGSSVGGHPASDGQASSGSDPARDSGAGGTGEGGGAAGDATDGGGAASGRDGATPATLMTYVFTAHIYSIDKGPMLSGAPAVGASVTGTLSFDPDPSHYPAGTTRYVQKAPGSGLFIQTGKWSFVPQATSFTSAIYVEPRRPDRSGLFYVSSGAETWIEKNMSNIHAEILLADPFSTLSNNGLALPATFDFTKLNQSYFGGLTFGSTASPHFEIKAIIDTFVRRD